MKHASNNYTSRFEILSQENNLLVERYIGKISTRLIRNPPKEVEVAGSIPAQGSCYYCLYNTTISLSHASLSIDFLPKNSEFLSHNIADENEM